MKTKSKRHFSPVGPGWFFYVPLLAFAVVFTQMLRSPASSVLLGFVLILPIVSFVHGIIGRASVQVFVMAEKSTAEKMESVSYEIRIVNPSFLPYPFATACILLPDDVGVRCTEGYVKIPLMPFGGCFINRSVTFRYRGNYAVGVGDLYISDLFRLFTFRKKENVYSQVTVYPRKLEFENPPIYSITDIPTDTASPILGADRSEQSGIREYVPGDSLKSIHWKLSSKTQDLQVREFTTNDSRHVWVLCDLAGHREVKRDDDESSAVVDEAKSSEKAARSVSRPAEEIKNKKRSITAAVSAVIGKIRDAVKSALSGSKRRRMIKRGLSENDADTIALIDQLIESNPKKQRRNKAEKKPEARTQDAATQNESVHEESPAVDDDELERRIDELEGGKKRGADSPLAAEYAADIDEYCADGVIEIAVSAVMRELMHGSRCTLVWFDPREKSGIMNCDIESLGDLERIYHRFATAPCITPDHEVSALAALVEGTGGMTVRVVTANIDPYAEASYEKMPSVYGGTGTGNVTEILLFNPEERYEDRAARRSYIDMCRAGLSSGGVNLTEVRRFMYKDGVLRLISVE